MLIQSISNQNYNNSQVSFKNLRDKVYKPVGKGFHVREFSHNRDTAVYRKDMDWKKLVKYLTKKFDNIPKVSVYNYGCSNLSDVDLSNVQTIGDNAFYKCSNLSDIDITNVIQLLSKKTKGFFV